MYDKNSDVAPIHIKFSNFTQFSPAVTMFPGAGRCMDFIKKPYMSGLLPGYGIY